MPSLFWDASALVKRYALEVGQQTVNVLFNTLGLDRMLTTAWGYTETYSVLLRRLNAGIIDWATFTASVTALQTEVVDSSDIGLLSISDLTIFASVALIRRHNLNATDAALLTALLDHIADLPRGSSPPVVVAAD